MLPGASLAGRGEPGLSFPLASWKIGIDHDLTSRKAKEIRGLLLCVHPSLGIPVPTHKAAFLLVATSQQSSQGDHSKVLRNCLSSVLVKARSCYIAQAGLEFVIFPPQPSECRDHGHAILYMLAPP